MILKVLKACVPVDRPTLKYWISEKSQMLNLNGETDVAKYVFCLTIALAVSLTALCTSSCSLKVIYAGTTKTKMGSLAVIK